MATELAAKAKEAFVDDDFDVAVDLYSKAIDLDPNCAEFFADRAQANIKLENFTGNFFVSVINDVFLLKENIKSFVFYCGGCLLGLWVFIYFVSYSVLFYVQLKDVDLAKSCVLSFPIAWQ